MHDMCESSYINQLNISKFFFYNKLKNTILVCIRYMDIVIVVVCAFLLLVGFAGCIIPIVPGLPIAYAGLLLADWRFNFFTGNYLWLMFLAIIVMTILDYYLPIWTAKRYGATSYGIAGSIIGMIAGMFLSPVGLIAGTIIGAIAGDMLAGRSGKQALLSGMATFAGTVLSIGLKLVVAGLMLWDFTVASYKYFTS